MTPCANCGGPIRPKPRCYVERRYCSPRCYHEANNRANRERYYAERAERKAP